ncbi:MAG: glycosyltransferase family 2 protein [Ilumatobacteraceae bacterium]|nr:glycosyltransferase family 2 protein [Ilumatobacteraceae bacterium]
MTPRVLIAIPAHNEAATIVEVVTSARSHGHPVLVVDDGSSDATGDLARRSGATVITLETNLGVGAARRRAHRYAVEHEFDIVVECDADGQHPTEDIPRLLDELARSGADLVIGSRFKDRVSGSIPLVRRLVMWLLSLVATRASGSRVTDSTSGFRAVRRPLIDAFAKSLPDHFLGDTFEIVVATGRAGYRVSECSVLMSNRVHGRATASSLQSVGLTMRALVNAIVLRQPRLQPRD